MLFLLGWKTHLEPRQHVTPNNNNTMRETFGKAHKNSLITIL
jgi:hypothetical protein